jgi:hypothetical protein
MSKNSIRIFVDRIGYIWLFWQINDNNIVTTWCKRYTGIQWQSDLRFGGNSGSLYYANLLGSKDHTWFLRKSGHHIWSHVNADGIWEAEPQLFGGVEPKYYYGSFSNENNEAWVVWGRDDSTGHSIWAKKL